MAVVVGGYKIVLLNVKHAGRLLLTPSPTVSTVVQEEVVASSFIPVYYPIELMVIFASWSGQPASSSFPSGCSIRITIPLVQ